MYVQNGVIILIFNNYNCVYSVINVFVSYQINFCILGTIYTKISNGCTQRSEKS